VSLTDLEFSLPATHANSPG